MQVESSLQDVQKDQLHNQGSLVIGQCSSLKYHLSFQQLEKGLINKDGNQQVQAVKGTRQEQNIAQGIANRRCSSSGFCIWF
jgi:hypothetical protein